MQGNSWGNSYIKFVLLDIKFHFTCGKSDLHKNIGKFQYAFTRINWKFFVYSLHLE